MTDNLRIEKDGVTIECTPWMLANHYDKVVELSHLAIRGTPVQPAEPQAAPLVDASKEAGPAALAQMIASAAKSDDPEARLREIRDSLVAAGGGDQLPNQAPIDRYWAKIDAVRKAAMEHAGGDWCGNPGLSGLKQDMMNIASRVKMRDQEHDETKDGLWRISEALSLAGVNVSYRGSSPIARTVNRIVDAIVVGRRRGLKFLPLQTGVHPQDDPNITTTDKLNALKGSRYVEPEEPEVDHVADRARQIWRADEMVEGLKMNDIHVEASEVLGWTPEEVSEVHEWIKAGGNRSAPPMPRFLPKTSPSGARFVEARVEVTIEPKEDTAAEFNARNAASTVIVEPGTIEEAVKEMLDENEGPVGEGTDVELTRDEFVDMDKGDDWDGPDVETDETAF